MHIIVSRIQMTNSPFMLMNLKDGRRHTTHILWNRVVKSYFNENHFRLSQLEPIQSIGCYSVRIMTTNNWSAQDQKWINWCLWTVNSKCKMSMWNVKMLHLWKNITMMMLMKGINESRNVVNQHQTDTIYTNDRHGQMQFHVYQMWFKNIKQMQK